MNNLISHYRSLKEARGDVFRFVPDDIPFHILARLLYLHSIHSPQEDLVLLDYVIADLQREGILINTHPLRAHTYTLPGSTIYDIYITTSDNRVYCRGTASSYIEACAKALGEVFERTISRFPSDRTYQVHSATELHRAGVPHIPPSAFAQPTDKQRTIFSSNIATDETLLAWIPVTPVLDPTCTVLAPLQTIYYSSQDRFKEPLIFQQTTNGLGAGYSHQHALSSAFAECIHRHHYLDAWYHTRDSAVIDTNTVPASSALSSLIHSLHERGFKVEILNFTENASVPTCITYLHHRGGVYCGGSTSTSLEKAAKRSVEEAFSIYLWSYQATLRGEYDITEELCNTLQQDTTDTRATGAHRVQLFATPHFITHHPVLTHVHKKLIPFLEESYTHTALMRAATAFENAYTYTFSSPLISKYSYHVVRGVLPQSYFFPLNDQHSRLILKHGDYPHHTYINPFP